MHRLLFLLIFFSASWIVSYSQVNINLQNVPPLFNVNTEDFPLIRINVNVTDGGNFVALTQKDFYILEESMVCEPLEVTPLQGGWQTITYYTKLYDFTKNSEYNAQLLTLYKNLPYRINLRGRMEWLPILTVIAGINNQQIRNASWPIVQPGNSIPFQIKLNGYLQNSRTFQQIPIKIDSLTTQTPIFIIDWLGPEIGEKRQPPAEIAAGIDYLVNIRFTPLENIYYQDILTIHFNNGMKRNIPLYGNSFKVAIEKLLVLTEPKPGTVLSPCQDVTIKWQGHDPNNPVEIYYSTNAGLDWKMIDVVIDSTYTWRLPNIENRFFRFRVRQDFQNSKEEILSEDRLPVFAVNYNYPGTKLSSINSMGKVLTWNLATGGKSEILNRQFIEENDEFSEQRFYSFGIEYTAKDDKFYVGYRNFTLPFFMQNDTIAVFNSAEINPVKKIPLPQGFRVRNTKSDRLKKYVAVFPEYGSRILQYSMETDELLREINFESPIMDIAFNSNSDSAAVLLINGRVKLVRLDEFTVFDELYFNNFPNFLNIAYSPNGRFLSLGTQADNSGLRTNVYLVDIESKKIARVFDPSAGNPVALYFNPTSTSLVVGSETDKQIAMYDLTTNQNSSNMFGHSGIMTDMKMSPSGFSIVSTSNAFIDNIVYRTFTYPQEDQSAGNLILELPKITDEVVRIDDTYQGTFNLHNITSICNIGRSMADIQDAYFQNSVNFRMPAEWKRDTAFATECLNFDIVYNPLDTGIVSDTLILIHCSKQYKIPFETYSIPRTLTLLNDGFDFGDVCIGDTVRREFPLFRNDDPVPLIVNYTLLSDNEDAYFGNRRLIRDTVLEPGEIFIVDIMYVPSELGLHEAEIFIHHSNQVRIFKTSKIRGRGIGSFVDISHETLRFIPEIPVRGLLLKNSGLTDVFFENFRTSEPNVFEVLTPGGFNLKPGEETLIEIRWNTVDESQGQLIIDANPCLVQRFINLDFYRGSSVFTLPTVVTEAYNEDVRIPVIYSNSENGHYAGVRKFVGEFTVNSKIFLPVEIMTKFNRGELLSNTVQNGLRTFTIEVEGDFDKSDTLAVIKGVAGLTDTDRSLLIMTENSVWSKFVTTVRDTGEIIIDGICEDRYIVSRNAIIGEMLVIPNPAVVAAKIRFELLENAEIKCEIIDNTGNVTMICDDFNGIVGDNILDLNLAKFGTGNYKIRLSSQNDFSVINLIILR
ncbi:MAG: WD40 repeat domain-containing protein [Candidatus Kapabacteria bacterium]|nr:WD40 repeat domain-containing protein [Ignavibacteriota bacterium]MCW5883656.1 WD40 repeat domain-containing protein [Candidatus Kapabacteria bacterium]